MKRLIYLLIITFYISTSIKLVEADDFNQASEKKIYGDWQALSTTSMSITGNLKITKNEIIFSDKYHIKITNPKTHHVINNKFYDLHNKYVVTFDVKTNTFFSALNKNKLCYMNANKVNLWISNYPGSEEEVITVVFTKNDTLSPKNPDYISKINCGIFNYLRLNSIEQ